MTPATISDRHVVTTRASCDLALLSCICLLGSATLSDVSASAQHVLQFRVSAQHSVLLNCRCGRQSRHRSSNLGNVTELPSSCTQLESTRSTQLLRWILQQVFENTTCVSLSVFASPGNHPRRALSSEQVAGVIGTTCACNDTSDVCRGYLNTHLLFLVRYRNNLESCGEKCWTDELQAESRSGSSGRCVAAFFAVLRAPFS